MIDKETFMPRLENVMKNFMQCSQMMFGSKVRYGISYKIDQPGFQIYTRKYFHNFKVTINSDNFEGAIGANLQRSKQYVLANGLDVGVYDQDTLKRIQTITVEGRNDESQVLFIKISHKEQKLAMTIGEELIKNTFNITDIIIYRKNVRGGFDLQKSLPFDIQDACP